MTEQGPRGVKLIEFAAREGMERGDHALYQEGDKFFLGLVEAVVDNRVHIKPVRELSSLEEGEAALARLRGEVH